MSLTPEESWMQRCLDLAARAQNRASPNPRVGAVLIGREGTVLGEGWHEACGSPHAEPVAIENALQTSGRDAVREATLYVNLEPCSHQGRTPPCTEAILKAGIQHVVYGVEDLNPQARGGAAHLRAHGVQVSGGVLRSRCFRWNEAFFAWMSDGCPLVTLKLAQTLDGCIATRSGESQWITGAEARKKVHAWRADSDAVMVGAGTALADDPALTVRRVNGTQPRRIVWDRKGLLPAHLQLFTDPWATSTRAVTDGASKPAYADTLAQRGGKLFRMSQPTLPELMAELGNLEDERPIQSLLVEAGPGLATALLRADLVDRLHVFVAPRLLGGGLASVGDLHIERLADCVAFAEHEWTAVGGDMLFTGYKRGVPQR